MTRRLLMLLVCVALAALVGPWLAPYDPETQHREFLFAPPMRPHLRDQGSWQAPFVYPVRLADRLAQRYEENRTRRAALPWFADGDEPVFLLGAVPTLKARGVKIHVGSAADMSKACLQVQADLEAGRLTHADQHPLNEARDGARKRAIGTAGGWGYDRRDPSVNIAPLVAVTLARLGASMTKKPTGAKGGGRRVVTG
jgi:hypothetical protein